MATGIKSSLKPGLESLLSTATQSMNYRHAFHAGNFADVFKHVVLVGLLQALKAKPAPFCYVDTHAGRGLYDLLGAAAEQTREHFDGIQRLDAASTLPTALQQYLNIVGSFNLRSDGATAQYPGSPLIAARTMRPDDRAILCELQTEEVEALRAALRDDRRFAIHQRDGYAALNALLPPEQKRGLVLIDPPFEAQADEFTLIENALADALKRWSNAIHAIWYPIKRRESIAPFHRWLRDNSGDADVLVAELLLHADNSSLRLNGCGIAIVNPPWRFEKELESWLPALHAALAQSRYGSWQVQWLRNA